MRAVLSPLGKRDEPEDDISNWLGWKGLENGDIGE